MVNDQPSASGVTGMKPKYEKPPYQPKWMLRLQVFLLRRRLFPWLSKQCLVITTTGRKSGRQFSVPIGYARDGESYLTFNAGGKANWYQNALANPRVALVIDGHAVAAQAEPVPVDTPEQLGSVLDVYRRERPGLIEDFFSVAPDTPVEALMEIGKYVVFMRFRPAA